MIVRDDVDPQVADRADGAGARFVVVRRVEQRMGGDPAMAVVERVGARGGAAHTSNWAKYTWV